ncbi:MAG: response regulator transcription factor, partial [Bacteroidia bacterium]|nr:response regulator transcription factor [Bacteroidia bacterium]
LEEEFSVAEIVEVADGQQLLKEIRKKTFNIVISDMSMPGVTGLEALKQLKEEFPKLPMLILSMHPEDQYAIRVLRAGAAGYLNKEAAADELVKAVKQILNGKRYISPAVADKLAENLDLVSNKALHETLSDREFAVLKLIASGKTVSEIAEILSLSVATISTYRARLLEKMRMKNNAELTRYGIDNNIV